MLFKIINLLYALWKFLKKDLPEIIFNSRTKEIDRLVEDVRNAKTVEERANATKKLQDSFNKYT